MKLLPILLAPSLASAAITIDWVTVGDAGNPADITGYGSVSYTYNIGKYEVTNAQYAEFLNAVAKTDTHGLYHSAMGSEIRGGIAQSGSSGSYSYAVKPNMGNKPVNFVSWYDAARFANWLHNGQPVGLQSVSTTEGGAYTLNGNTGLIEKNSSATIWIPTEDEWYKAAYYDPTPGAGGNNYWLYPTQSDSAPTVALANSSGDISNPGANVANYSMGANWNGQSGNLTTVGSALSESYYGTLDQGGNVYERNDAIINASRGLRGGSSVFSNSPMQATTRSGYSPAGHEYDVGFRLASVPEPSSSTLTALFIACALVRRKRANT